MNFFHKLGLVFGLFAICSPSKAQNLDGVVDGIKNKEPFVFSGNVATGTSFYTAVGRENRRNPFAYYITASPTISFRGFSLPFNFSYRDQKGSISHPFHRFSISPSYKWVSIGYGTTSLDLNPYIFSGHFYKGASLQLTPKNFKLKLGYGTLENPFAQIDTLVEGMLIVPTYNRKIMAGLVGFGSSAKFVELSILRVKDIRDSLSTPSPQINQLNPQENLAAGLNFGFSFWKNFNLKANTAASALTSNQASIEDFSGAAESPALKALSNIFTYNISSKLSLAGDASLNFKLKKFGTGIEYKRVAPMYKTLGTFYFQEDFQSLSLKMNLTAFKSKLRLTSNVGVQQNNLNKVRESTRTRKIINLSLNFAPTKNFTTTIRAANFQSDRTPTLTRLNDTIKFTQSTENYSIVPILVLRGEQKTTTISVMANYQKLIDLGLNLGGNEGIDNYTGNISCSVFDKKTDVTIAGSAIYNKNIAGFTENQRIGLNANVSKRLLDKKINVFGNVGFTKNDVNQVSDGFTITTAAGFNYKIKKKLDFALATNLLVRNSDTQAYQEYRGTAKISYQFTTKKDATK